jgi:hypothetical protein
VADNLECKAGHTHVGMHKNFLLNTKPSSNSYVGIELSNIKYGQILKSRKMIQLYEASARTAKNVH